MDMIRVAAFVDFQNLEGQLRHVNRKPDMQTLRQYLGTPEERRHVEQSFVFASLPPNNGDGIVRYHDWLRHQGYIVVSKRAKELPDGSRKANVDALMMLDILEYAINAKPDVIVLVTGDGDFAEIGLRLRRRGIRVEVASLHTALANELKQAANGVIDLTEWANTCAARRDDEEVPELGADLDEAV